MWTSMTLLLHAHACLNCKLPRQRFFQAGYRADCSSVVANTNYSNNIAIRAEHTDHSATEVTNIDKAMLCGISSALKKWPDYPLQVATFPFRSSHCYITFHAFSVVIGIENNPQRILFIYPRKMAA